MMGVMVSLSNHGGRASPRDPSTSSG